MKAEILIFFLMKTVFISDGLMPFFGICPNRVIIEL